MNTQNIQEEFRRKFGQFYVSIDAETKAVRTVDIENGIKVNGNDGHKIECVASRDIEDYFITKISQSLEAERERVRAKIEGKREFWATHSKYKTSPRLQGKVEGLDEVLQDLLKEI